MLTQQPIMKSTGTEVIYTELTAVTRFETEINAQDVCIKKSTFKIRMQ